MVLTNSFCLRGRSSLFLSTDSKVKASLYIIIINSFDFYFIHILKRMLTSTIIICLYGRRLFNVIVLFDFAFDTNNDKA